MADCQKAAGKLEIGKGEKMSDSDNQLFEHLAIKHMDNLYSNAIRLTRSAKGAEYLVQQTYATAYCVFEQFDRNSDFGKWLTEILMLIYTNTCHYLQEPVDNCSRKAVQGD
jgi:RNA polymerase sigma-70 factor (ECF subfamily)